MTELSDLRAWTADIVSAYVSRNHVAASDLATVIGSVQGALAGLTAPEEPEQRQTPAVPIKRSVTNEAIICLEDGRKLTSLKRHLRVKYNLTPEQYREKWGLPKDYPMVAPGYAAKRSELAKLSGLGSRGRGGDQASPREGGGDTVSPSPNQAAAPKRSSRSRRATPSPA